MTENQIVAAVITFVLLLVIWMMDVFAVSIKVDFIKQAIMSMSFYTRYAEITTGIFNFTTVLFYLSVTVVFNFLTVRVFEKRRWA
jgi:ABC-2 type transport system permease protein